MTAKKAAKKTPSETRSRRPVAFRFLASELEVIDKACKEVHRNRTDFMLYYSIRAAREIVGEPVAKAAS